MDNTAEKLDRLAEYQAQKDSIDAQKRALLDDVKVPAEVEAIVKAGMNQIGAVDRSYYAKFDAVEREVSAQLAKIVIPEEIKLALAAIDRERALVQAYKAEKERGYREEITAKKQELQGQYEAQTRDVYAALARRKAEIEAEFAGKLDSVDANISKLKAEIEADVLAKGESVKGRYFMAVWNKGRAGTWDSGKLDGLALVMPQIAECRNPGGKPTVTFRAVK